MAKNKYPRPARSATTVLQRLDEATAGRFRPDKHSPHTQWQNIAHMAEGARFLITWPLIRRQVNFVCLPSREDQSKPDIPTKGLSGWQEYALRCLARLTDANEEGAT